MECSPIGVECWKCFIVEGSKHEIKEVVFLWKVTGNYGGISIH